MDWGQWFALGFLSTIVLTTIMAGSQGLGMTRMNIPYLLGTVFTPNRDRAKLIGVIFHLINGWIFSLIYIGIFVAFNTATWWFGALLGLLHGLFNLMVAMPMMPSIHPRMANEQYGPTVVRQLEPPGFFALHYGIQTPISVTVAHVIFGMILGGFYFIR